MQAWSLHGSMVFVCVLLASQSSVIGGVVYALKANTPSQKQLIRSPDPSHSGEYDYLKYLCLVFLSHL